MAAKKSTKKDGTKKPTKTQLNAAKKAVILSNLGRGFAGQYSNDALENINIEIINNKADIKDTLLITFIDEKTGDPSEQWKVTLVRKSKMWQYGEDYLDEDIKESFTDGYDENATTGSPTEDEENVDTDSDDTDEDETADTECDDAEENE